MDKFRAVIPHNLRKYMRIYQPQDYLKTGVEKYSALIPGNIVPHQWLFSVRHNLKLDAYPARSLFQPHIDFGWTEDADWVIRELERVKVANYGPDEIWNRASKVAVEVTVVPARVVQDGFTHWFAISRVFLGTSSADVDQSWCNELEQEATNERDGHSEQ